MENSRTLKRSLEAEDGDSSSTKRSCEENDYELDGAQSDVSCSSGNQEKRPECDSSVPANRNKSFTSHFQTKDVGITEYISTLPGFSAVIKERYSDFLVNELDLNGQVVKLTDMNEPVQEMPVQDFGDTEVFSSTELECLINLQETTQSNASLSLDVTSKDKEIRRKIHQTIKSFRGLDSTTITNGALKTIVVTKGQSKRRNYYPPGQGNYTHFVLYKENKDTMEAVSTITSILRLSPKTLSYAGTKDKRGKTSQLVSAYKVKANKLLGVNKKLNLIKIGNVAYKNCEIKLGDLSGNKFVVVLRQVKGVPDVINEAMSSLSLYGFINYYGMQRFGTTSVATHRIGRALLLGNWDEAVDLILQPRSNDDSLANAREIWSKTRNAHSALTHMHHQNSIEGRLLCGLARHTSNNPLNALNSIPRNTRLMYVHSYQSYIWNKVLSKRIKKFRLSVLPGDLISERESGSAESIEESQTVKTVPKYVTEDDVQKDDLIYNVVLPLPGYSMLYPKNETKTWFEEFLKEDGMDLQKFKSPVRAYSLSGSYRKIVVKPTDVEWELIPYDDNCVPLALSDWDVLQGVDLAPRIQDGKHQALKMELKLPSSSYATMAIREILKMDTCVTTPEAENT